MFTVTPHRRYNPLTDEWLLVSPQRTQRPWQGQVEDIPEDVLPAYDPKCYLCPGNSRVGDAENPPYTETFVFNNDFPSLLPNSSEENPPEHPLFKAQAERGICRVICFSPRHDWTLAHLPLNEVRRVVDVWSAQTQELAEHDWLHYVQIFENKGSMMGSSNPHPHGQLWATENLPTLVKKEDSAQRRYFEANGHTLLSDVFVAEKEAETRIIWQDENWMVIVPFWAVWPFETLLIPQRPVQFVYQLTDDERNSLAQALSDLTIRYDNLFKTRFPYSMGIHQAPVNTPDVEHWHLHLHFFPPLLRSASVKKFMVGYELMAGPQRDITAEQAAQRLRDLSNIRFA